MRKPITLTDLAEPHRSQILGQLKKLDTMKSALKIASTPCGSQGPFLSLVKKSRGMNGTETEFHQKLIASGTYDRVRYESMRLELGNGAWYTPDFVCTASMKLPRVTSATIIVIYEVKNAFIREASLVRLKVAARTYPEFCFILAQKKNGKWTEKRIEN
jgi:hypothetical protein